MTMGKSIRHGDSAGRLARVFLGAVILLVLASPARADSPPESLERGIYLEETKGDLAAAGAIYRQIVDDPSAERSFVAQAQLRLGLCELKLGHKPQAITAFDRLTQEFPDKNKLMGVVENHMPQVLDEMLRQIEQNYIKEVDRSELMEVAIRAIVGKLDAGSPPARTNDLLFMDTNEVVRLSEHLEQKIGGIGVMLRFDETNHFIRVEQALPDSPALRGGLRAGDRLVSINGHTLPADFDFEQEIRRLRGNPGDPVTVGVTRPGGDGVISIRLVRDTVRLASIMGDHLRLDQTWDFLCDAPHKIGYIRLLQIGVRTPEEIQTTLGDLARNGMRGLILDLRDNPGGVLASAVEVASLFIDAGRVVTVKGRMGEQTYETRPGKKYIDFPLALLVDRKTASAAEVVAACLQDRQRAVVVGERTFGQGLVRSVISLPGGMGAVRLPVAAFYRADGKPLNRYPDSQAADAWGVRPDPGYEVPLTDTESGLLAKSLNDAESRTSGIGQNGEGLDRPFQKALDYIIAQLAKN